MMAGSKDKLIVFLAQMLRQILLLKNWNIHMKTVVVADSDL